MDLWNLKIKWEKFIDIRFFLIFFIMSICKYNIILWIAEYYLCNMPFLNALPFYYNSSWNKTKGIEL